MATIAGLSTRFGSWVKIPESIRARRQVDSEYLWPFKGCYPRLRPALYCTSGYSMSRKLVPVPEFDPGRFLPSNLARAARGQARADVIHTVAIFDALAYESL